MDENKVSDREIFNKLIRARTNILKKYPFYGTLLMHLKLSLAECGTACTDMKRIIWDKNFVQRLTSDEIEFVMMHEVMHCVLGHCVRSEGCIHYIHNIAADIVVNSNILESLKLTSFTVDGVEAMHLAPDNKEGRLYTVEQVYDMLMKKYKNEIDDAQKLINKLKKAFGKGIDDHDIWQTVLADSSLQDAWKINIKEAAKAAGNMILPQAIRDYMRNEEYRAQLRWKQILQEFIELSRTRQDFLFTPSDRRFSDSDFIMPSFSVEDPDSVDNIWFLVDTSGSISDDTLSTVMAEIRDSLRQFEHVDAKLSFFDTVVTKPVSFDNVEQFDMLEATGGGGTSFVAIFDYMKENMLEELPAAVIILTDGYAWYPDEEVALNVPTMWIIVDNNTDAPFGKTVHINTMI